LVNFKTTEAAKIFAEIAAPVLGLYDAEKKNARTSETETAPAATSPARKEEDGDMKIAIPVVQGRLSMHFGHCDEFVIVDVDPVKREILGSETVDAPPHEPGLLPVWLKELGADLIITGGMGSRAQMLFKEKGIDVMVGASSDEPEAIVKAYLDGTLATGTNICDH
jgi:ATP-binding protein involved in chromosome partitioning